MRSPPISVALVAIVEHAKEEAARGAPLPRVESPGATGAASVHEQGNVARTQRPAIMAGVN
jgi:hypothetical protein